MRDAISIAIPPYFEDAPVCTDIPFALLTLSGCVALMELFDFLILDVYIFVSI